MTNMRGYRRYLPGIQLASGRDLRVFFHCNVVIDRELNALGYILPGLGDAGDRIFGTRPDS